MSSAVNLSTGCRSRWYSGSDRLDSDWIERLSCWMHSSMVRPFVDETIVWMMSVFVAYLDLRPQAICELLLSGWNGMVALELVI